MRFIGRIPLYVWAFPNTLIGLLAGVVGLLTGGRFQIQRGCIEFHGGAVTWFLEKLPPAGVLAMTLGHSIIGRSATALTICRDHEHVHVKQYERWGPLFLPLYLGWSLFLWLRRRDAYRENPFELEAYSKSNPSCDNLPEEP